MLIAQSRAASVGVNTEPRLSAPISRSCSSVATWPLSCIVIGTDCDAPAPYPSPAFAYLLGEHGAGGKEKREGGSHCEDTRSSVFNPLGPIL